MKVTKVNVNSLDCCSNWRFGLLVDVFNSLIVNSERELLGLPFNKYIPFVSGGCSDNARMTSVIRVHTHTQMKSVCSVHCFS